MSYLKNRHGQTGFTIVELLIVIVVIAILAAITIVSYNGITRNAQISALKSELGQAATKLNIVKTTTDDSYPAALPSDLSTGSINTKYTYTSTNATRFCLSAASLKTSTLVFNITEAGQIQDGYCTGHEPVPPTNSGCFAFDSASKTITGYYNNEGNNSANPACPRGVNIPDNIGGVAVNILGSFSFSGRNITSVTIPNSVTSIENGAFWSNQLTSITIPSLVTIIDINVFAHNQLASVTMLGPVTSIGGDAFSWNLQLTSITIPSSVTSIGTHAFERAGFSTVSIPTATVLQSNAFDAEVTITRY